MIHDGEVDDGVVDPQINTAIQGYLDACRARNLAPRSVEAYRYALTRVFLPWCREQELERMGDLDQGAFDAFSQHVLGKAGRGVVTAHTYLKAVRAFRSWAEAERIRVRGRPRLPRINRRRVVQILTREEINRLERVAPTERDKLIVRVLADTGIRIGELVRLRPEDLLQLERQWYLRIDGKGGHERLVPVPRLWRRLRAFIDARPEPCDHAIFLLLKRKNGVYRALTRMAVYQVLRSLAIRANITKRMYPHLFRHSLISHLRSRGYNDAQIRIALGNFTHLDIYTHLDSKDAYNMFEELA
jgi:site-specific recombinase XerD